LAIREKPKLREIRISTDGSWVSGAGRVVMLFATWVPAKAKNKNMKVPTNSARQATLVFRTLSETFKRLRDPFSGLDAVVVGVVGLLS
jgi:hypothetical protein